MSEDFNPKYERDLSRKETKDYIKNVMHGLVTVLTTNNEIRGIEGALFKKARLEGIALHLDVHSMLMEYREECARGKTLNTWDHPDLEI